MPKWIKPLAKKILNKMENKNLKNKNFYWNIIP